MASVLPKYKDDKSAMIFFPCYTTMGYTSNLSTRESHLVLTVLHKMDQLHSHYNFPNQPVQHSKGLIWGMFMGYPSVVAAPVVFHLFSDPFKQLISEMHIAVAIA
jgi:hypothetical protein